MFDRSGLAPHELLELRELLTGEVTSAQRLETTVEGIYDLELKMFIENSLIAKRRRIDRMEKLLQESVGQQDT